MLISVAVHAVFLCEQPMGSADVFPNHPRLSWLCNRVAIVSFLHGTDRHFEFDRLLKASDRCSQFDFEQTPL